MKFEYKTWEPNRGYEDDQARIYNLNNSGTVTGKEIIERYTREKIDPMTVRYVFDQSGKMVAYCQARDYQEIKETHIGYPWAIAECTPKAQEKIFNDLLNYLKQRKTDLAIRFPAGGPKFAAVSEFARKKGFQEGIKFISYLIDVPNLLKISVTNLPYTTRIATSADLDLLVQLYLRLVPKASKENTENYFKTTLFPNAKTCIVFKENQTVGAGAPFVFPNNPNQIVFRFFVMDDNQPEAMLVLLKDVYRLILEKHWEKLPLAVNYRDNDRGVELIKPYVASTTTTGIRYIVN